MKSFKEYTFSLPFYPVQVSPEKDDGEWAIGDPPRPIEDWGTNDDDDLLRSPPCPPPPPRIDTAKEEGKGC